MYVIGHLYYLELTEKLPMLGLDCLTRLQYFRLLKTSVIKGMKIVFVQKNALSYFPMIFQLSFSGASKILLCGNVPDGG